MSTDNNFDNERWLFLDGNVDGDIAGYIVQKILSYNREDNDFELCKDARQPIKLYISTDGGDPEYAYQIIDIIRCSKTPVYTINIGKAYSSGLLIALAGHKRFATKNASYLLHDGSMAIEDNTCKVIDYYQYMDKMTAREREFIAQQSNITEEDFNNNIRRDWYFFADEAKQLGCVEYIVDEDCSFDCIV